MSSTGLPLKTRPPDSDTLGPSGGSPEPPDDWDRSGGGSGWVPLLRAKNDIEAHLLTGRLSEGGVESAILKDRFAPGAWLHGGSDPWAPVTILVRRIQLEDARFVLAEVAFEAPAVSASAVRVDRARRGRLVWWAAAIGLGVLFTGLGLLQTAEEMERCARGVCADSPTSTP